MGKETTSDDIFQIDCNNPNIDYCVVTRYTNPSNPLILTQAGTHIEADHQQDVPYACPLTRSAEIVREVEDFVKVCSDCPHSYISHVPVITV